jgi:hypothetical protein
MANQYQKLPVPGYNNPIADYVDPEILYSTVGFTQKGVTLGSGVGVLAAGTLLGQKTSDKKYYRTTTRRPTAPRPPVASCGARATPATSRPSRTTR